MQHVPPAIVEPAPVQPAAGPATPAERPWATAAWRAQHAAVVQRSAQGDVDVVYLGDSITEFFATRAPSVFAAANAGAGTVADYGIAGDRTQFLLWRVEHGELEGISPRVVVLLIGTNNLAAATPVDVAHGIEAIVTQLRTRLPGAVIVLNALFPRGSDPTDPLRIESSAVNTLIAPLADGTHVRWLDATTAFLTPDGDLRRDLLPDGLHPNEAGYEVWSGLLRPFLITPASSLATRARAASDIPAGDTR